MSSFVFYAKKLHRTQMSMLGTVCIVNTYRAQHVKHYITQMSMLGTVCINFMRETLNVQYVLSSRFFFLLSLTLSISSIIINIIIFIRSILLHF
jgi:hypothetical protein